MNHLTPEQSKARLQSHRAPGKRGKKNVKPLEHIDTIGIAEDDMYIFGNADGRILTSAYDSFRPIIGAWSSCDDIPPAMCEWLNEYADEIEWYKRVGYELDVESGAASTSERKTIPHFIPTKWAQNAPFNNNLIFDGKKCLVGCAAVAIGQVFYDSVQKGYERGCTAVKAYKTETNLYDVAALPPVTVFDCEHLTKNKPTTKVEIEAVAKLLEYIGKALQSDYGQGSTLVYTNKIAPVMKNNLRLGSGIKEVNSAYTSVANFENTVYNEIAAHHPVILFGKNDKSGHFFVCDGYDASTDLYWMNWGWGGSCDGYFAMSALNPTSSKAYNSRKRAYVGIQPDYKKGDVNGDGIVDITDAMQAIQQATKGQYSECADINNDGQVTVTDAQLIINHILGK